MVKKLKRRKDGRFRPKSDEDRKVRSIRATDSAWESLGDLAASNNMSRADLVEQLVQDGSLKCLQGLDALSNWSDQFPEGDPLQGEPATQVEPLPSLEPIQELVQRLEPVQELAQKLEPIQELVQRLEPVQELAQKLEPIQELAQKLRPIQGINALQAIGKDVEIIREVAQGIGGRCDLSTLTSMQKRAIALEMLDQFLKTIGTSAASDASTLSQFRHWLEGQA